MPYSDIGCDPCQTVPRSARNIQIAEESPTTFYDTVPYKGEPLPKYNERVESFRSVRKVSQDPREDFPFESCELITGDPLFDQAYGSSLIQSFYNMFVHESAKRIQNDFLSFLTKLKNLSDDRVAALSSGVDKSSLYEDVKSMGARLDVLRRSFPPDLSKVEVLESQDDEDSFTVDRLQELKKMFTTVHFPKLGLQL